MSELKVSVLIIPGKCCLGRNLHHWQKITLPPVVLVVTNLTSESGENYNQLQSIVQCTMCIILHVLQAHMIFSTIAINAVEYGVFFRSSG